MFNFRDKVLVSFESKKVEGYVFAVQSHSELYVIVAGENTKPILVKTSQCQLLLDPSQVKRKRGRPRKEK